MDRYLSGSAWDLRAVLTVVGFVVTITIAFIGWWLTRRARQPPIVPRKVALYEAFIEIVRRMNDPNPFVNDPELLPLVEKTRTSVQVYGDDDDKAAYERFVSAITAKGETVTEEELGEIKASLFAMRDMALDRIRKHLG